MTAICYSPEHPEKSDNPGIRSLYRSFEAARWRDEYGLHALDIWNVLWLIAPELDDLPRVEEKTPLPLELRDKVTAVCFFMIQSSPEFQEALRTGGAWQALRELQANPGWGVDLTRMLGRGWEAKARARLPEGLNSPFMQLRKSASTEISGEPGIVIPADFSRKH